MNKRKKKKQKNIISPVPPVTTQTQKTIEMMTDPAGFQRLCDDFLAACRDYKISPRGVNVHGTIPGQPDSWALDTQGKLCALAYGISSAGDWETKLYDDLEKVHVFTLQAVPSSQPSVFIFCTNCSINSAREQILKTQVQAQYGWELRLFGSGDISVALDTKRHDLRDKHLKIRVEYHNWQSLLTACQKQRQLSIVRQEVRFDPDMYLSRGIERMVEAWYYKAVDWINLRNKPSSSAEEHRGDDTLQQLFIIVDQAGAGKSTLVLHLAEHFGNIGPVIVLAGSTTITHNHAIKFEIVESLKDGDDSRTYHSDLKALCKLAQDEGYPLLVILDAIDANSDPRVLQNALKQLLTGYQNTPLLLLITCRDVVWPHFYDPLFRTFAYKDQNQPFADVVFLLGLYNDDEFEQARDRYFRRWDIRAELGPRAELVLRSPLLLNIFSEAYAGRSLGYVPNVVDNELWNSYWENKMEVVARGMERSLDQEAISNALEMVAERMVANDRLQLSLMDLTGIDHLDPYDTRPESLMSQLQNAGILQKIPERSRSGAIRFAYDVFLEFVLGRKLAHEIELPSKRTNVLERIEQLASNYRWHQVPLYLASLVSEPESIIERLRSINPWFAAQALLRVKQRTVSTVRHHIIRDLVEQLGSRYTLNCRRASRYLGLLGAHESTNALLSFWAERRLSTTLLALARLGQPEIVRPFIRYLGRYPQWYLSEDQELVDTLPGHFRELLQSMALELLEDPEDRFAAAQTLGFLRAERAGASLQAQFESSGCTDWIALLALLHIGIEEAFDVLQWAITEVGERITRCDQLLHDAQPLDNGLPTVTQTRHELIGTLIKIRSYGLQHSPLKEILPLLRRFLMHPNWYVRCEAVYSLTALKAAELTVALLQSARLGENDAITRALESFGPQIRIEPVLALIEDEATPELIMRYAIQALGFSRDPRALAPLSTLMNQPEHLSDTIQALGHLGRPEAVLILAEILEKEGLDSQNPDICYDFAVVALGHIRHPSAYAPLERFTRRLWPYVWSNVIEALVVTGREKALPLLFEVWDASVAPLTRRTILSVLLWLNTEKAMTTLLQLLAARDGEIMVILISELMYGGNLLWIGGGNNAHGPLDDRLVTLIISEFEHLGLESQHQALYALAHAQTFSAQQFLESIAENPVYDLPISVGVPLHDHRTLRTEAFRLLRSQGASSTIDSVIDETLKVAVQGYAGGVDDLAKMEHEAVIDALRARLSKADEIQLARLLELLGFFSDSRLLPEIRMYMQDPRPKVADAAYEAEQKILGVMEIWEW
jgi:HEAT repeat protein